MPQGERNIKRGKYAPNDITLEYGDDNYWYAYKPKESEKLKEIDDKRNGINHQINENKYAISQDLSLSSGEEDYYEGKIREAIEANNSEKEFQLRKELEKRKKEQIEANNWLNYQIYSPDKKEPPKPNFNVRNAYLAEKYKSEADKQQKELSLLEERLKRTRGNSSRRKSLELRVSTLKSELNSSNANYEKASSGNVISEAEIKDRIDNSRYLYNERKKYDEESKKEREKEDHSDKIIYDELRNANIKHKNLKNLYLGGKEIPVSAFQPIYITKLNETTAKKKYGTIENANKQIAEMQKQLEKANAEIKSQGTNAPKSLKEERDKLQATLYGKDALLKKERIGYKIDKKYIGFRATKKIKISLSANPKEIVTERKEKVIKKTQTISKLTLHKEGIRFYTEQNITRLFDKAYQETGSRIIYLNGYAINETDFIKEGNRYYLEIYLYPELKMNVEEETVSLNIAYTYTQIDILTQVKQYTKEGTNIGVERPILFSFTANVQTEEGIKKKAVIVIYEKQVIGEMAAVKKAVYGGQQAILVFTDYLIKGMSKEQKERLKILNSKLLPTQEEAKERDNLKTLQQSQLIIFVYSAKFMAISELSKIKAQSRFCYLAYNLSNNEDTNKKGVQGTWEIIARDNESAFLGVASVPTSP